MPDRMFLEPSRREGFRTRPATNRMMDPTLRRIDSHHHLRPFCDPEQIEASGPNVITRGDGVFVEDERGNRLIDGMAGLWCVQVGYGRPELIEAARDQLERLPFYNTFFASTTEPLATLVDMLRTRTPAGLDTFLFANSGSEAIDTAVRLVRHHWALKGKPDRRIVIGRTLGYHGSTQVAASVGGMSGMHMQGGLPLPDFAHIEPPYPFRDQAHEDLDGYGRQMADLLDAKIRALGAHRVAAFVGEPLMGAGGVIIPPGTYWPRIQEICREHDVILVVDEVICGFGRTGRMWGCDTFGIEPDVITMAKGLTSGYVPMSAVALSAGIADVLRTTGVLQHGFTYSGHPVAAAVAVANLRVIEGDDLIGGVERDTGPRLARRLEDIARHPLLGEVRSCGLIAGGEIVRSKVGNERFEPGGRAAAVVRDACYAEGLVLRAIREGFALCPPLTITVGEVDTLVDRLAAGLDRAAHTLARDR